jgi:hypothetical protein
LDWGGKEVNSLDHARSIVQPLICQKTLTKTRSNDILPFGTQYHSAFEAIGREDEGLQNISTGAEA